MKPSFKWIVLCPVHGWHSVNQKSKPKRCKITVKTGERSYRRCDRELTEWKDENEQT